MHLIRRSAFRAISSQSTSFLTKPRSITTTSPFLLRSKPQAFVSPVFRRFASDDVGSETSPSKEPSNTDPEDSSSVLSAIESASESASTYASETADSISESVDSAKDTFVDAAEAVGTAAGFSAPRSERRPYGGDRQERRPSARRGDDSRGPRNENFVLAPTNSVYVGNLLFDVTTADLEKEFSEFGNVNKITIATDARGMSKGFGYIEFDSVAAAQAAIDQKHQTVFEGRRIIVNFQAQTKREPRKVNVPSKTLFIGNLAFEMSDADLHKLFREIKNVIDVRVAIDRRTGQPRGFAHADFVDIESAEKGLAALQGKEVYGRPLRLDFSGGAQNREDRFAAFRRDGGQREPRESY